MRITDPAALLILAMAACESAPTSGPIDRLPREPTLQEATVIEASNAFAFRLFGRLTSEEPHANVFVSPLSASMMLGMALNGADGETATEIQQTLGLGRLELEEINRSYRDLSRLLVELDPAVDVRIANSIWYRDGFPVLPEFLATNREHFDAEVAGLDFNDPAALETINGWVEEKTVGKIPTIIDRIDPAHVLFLINAMYFKGLWEYPFDPRLTHDASFHLQQGDDVTVTMMSRDSVYPYVDAETYRAIDLSYGGGLYAMTVVVPEEGVRVADLATDLDAERWTSMAASLAEQRVVVSLPRFEVEYEKTLNETLQDLGIRIAFTGAADFSRITPGGGIWIDYVKQKAYVKVDEKGTEAAAATVGAFPTSLPPELRADRPFLFAIRERSTGTILFIGQITDPSG